ncbi:tetratricopeptide repeat protein [Amycolatopsis sp. NPDC059657]|uniref:tetratricopeptide repeat protein n=1 Tax=Amycolatopsis sp. NPDC059657 TaxID=3346899 RepID=UPI00366CC3C9
MAVEYKGTKGAAVGLPEQTVFRGREAELVRLADALRPGTGAPVTAIAGLAGIGKTALAMQAAHNACAEGWFPGGAVMVNMHGYGPSESEVSVSAALTSLLGAIGIASKRIPPLLDGQVGLWRSELARWAAAGKRLLIVVDNVSRAEQVRPLLPGKADAAGHRVLVTSRHCMSAVQGTRLMDLDVLGDEQAVELLRFDLATSLPGDVRVGDDPQAASRIAQLCGGLPLAVRICSALLAADPEQPLSELVEALADEKVRLVELDFDDVLAVRAAFDLSYEHLSAEQARLFRLMAINPDTVTSTESAAALAELGVPAARRVIKQLHRAHLVSQDVGRDRWRMHDLLRLYAAERISDDTERQDAVSRLLAHFLATTVSASQHLDPRLDAADRDRRFTSRHHALAWLDAERPSLVGSVDLAYSMGRYTSTGALAAALYDYFELRKHLADWIATAELALTAARRLGNRRSEGLALTHVGNAHRDLGQHQRALEHHRLSLDIARAASDRYAEGRCLTNLGNAYLALGRTDEAVRFNEESLRIRRQLNDRYGQRITLNHLGNAYRHAGRMNDAVDCYLESLEIRREMGDPNGEGRTLTNLGNAYRALGRVAEAIECYRQDLVIARELGDRHAEASTLTSLGNGYRDQGSREPAVECYLRSAEISREIGDREGEQHTLTNLANTYRELGRAEYRVRTPTSIVESPPIVDDVDLLCFPDPVETGPNGELERLDRDVHCMAPGDPEPPVRKPKANSTHGEYDGLQAE